MEDEGLLKTARWLATERARKEPVTFLAWSAFRERL